MRAEEGGGGVEFAIGSDARLQVRDSSRGSRPSVDEWGASRGRNTESGAANHARRRARELGGGSDQTVMRGGWRRVVNVRGQ